MIQADVELELTCEAELQFARWALIDVHEPSPFDVLALRRRLRNFARPLRIGQERHGRGGGWGVFSGLA
jgi:hypothetical protein